MRVFLAGVVLLLLAAGDAAWFIWAYLDESCSSACEKLGGFGYTLFFVLVTGAFVCFFVAAFRAARRRFTPDA